MCGRFDNARTAEELARLEGAGFPEGVGLAEGAEAFTGSYNVAPRDLAPILVGGAAPRVVRPTLGLARFGHAAGSGRLVLNARAESARSKPLFARGMEARRCLVPATGFYEWERRGRGRLPHRFHPAGEHDGDALLLFGGIFFVSRGAPPSSEARVVEFVILTVPAIEPVASIHDRMPLLVRRALAPRWLDRASPRVDQLLAEVRSSELPSLQRDRVSLLVNSPRSEGARLIEPIPDREAPPPPLDPSWMARSR